MDGQVADLQQRTLHVHQQRTGVHLVLASDNHPSCQRQRTVEPRGHDGAAIHLRVQFHDAALAGHLGVGLDAERGRVAMGANHVEPHIGQCLATHLESIDRRVVLRHIQFVTSRHLPYRHLGVETAEARLLQFF